MANPGWLVAVFAGWVIACVLVGVWALRRAPLVSFALLGSVVGAVLGGLIGDANGPAEVPAYAAVGASGGLVSFGLVGIWVVPAHPSSAPLGRTALLVLGSAPFAAGALTIVLRFACPLYVSGKHAGFCNYQGVDVLGGWLSGVIVAFLFDAVVVSSLLALSAYRARREERTDPDR